MSKRKASQDFYQPPFKSQEHDELNNDEEESLVLPDEMLVKILKSGTFTRKDASNLMGLDKRFHVLMTSKGIRDNVCDNLKGEFSMLHTSRNIAEFVTRDKYIKLYVKIPSHVDSKIPFVTHAVTVSVDQAISDELWTINAENEQYTLDEDVKDNKYYEENLHENRYALTDRNKYYRADVNLRSLTDVLQMMLDDGVIFGTGVMEGKEPIPDIFGTDPLPLVLWKRIYDQDIYIIDPSLPLIDESYKSHPYCTGRASNLHENWNK